MKIFIVQSHLGGGGAERVGVLLANGFASHGHQVIVATDLTVNQNYIPLANVKLFNIITRHWSVILKWLYAIKELRAILKKERPDVIIGIMQLCSLVSFMASFRLHIPVVMTEHYAFERPGKGLTRLETFSKFYINRLYALVTVLTNADKSLIGNKLKRVVVVNNPLSFPPVMKVPKKENVVLAVGRLDGWYVKGFDVLIRAWALVNGQLKIDNGQLSSTGESWKLQIAGAGSEKSLNYLKQLCKENGVEDSVEFLGFRKDVEKLYQDASIFVLSSRYEGFGLVLIEAMSQGCACVACDYKGRQREIISPTPTSSFSDGLRKRPVAERPRREGEPSIESQSLGTRNSKPETRNYKVEVCENGILCEPDDVESLAAGIQKMMTDDEYREYVRKYAIERSDYYNLDNTMERWESLLVQLTNKDISC